MKICYSCKKEITIKNKPTRNDVCENCGAYIKVCSNCMFFTKSGKCNEPQAEWVQDRQKANFCEYFSFINTDMQCGKDIKFDDNDSAKSREKFECLFKK